MRGRGEEAQPVVQSRRSVQWPSQRIFRVRNLALPSLGALGPLDRLQRLLRLWGPHKVQHNSTHHRARMRGTGLEGRGSARWRGSAMGRPWSRAPAPCRPVASGRAGRRGAAAARPAARGTRSGAAFAPARPATGPLSPSARGGRRTPACARRAPVQSGSPGCPGAPARPPVATPPASGHPTLFIASSEDGQRGDLGLQTTGVQPLWTVPRRRQRCGTLHLPGTL